MKLHDIRELIKLVNQSSIEELEWEKGSTSIVIKKAAPVVVAAEMEPVVQVAEVETGYQEAAVTAEAAEQAPVVQETIHTITSTAVGIFSTSVAAGQKVQSGDVVGRCSVDALQLSQDIVSPFDGEVVELLAEDGQLIDYGKALLTVKQG
ncbi:acetyl-CoA carboxylase biotin carboxyl carrier protein subunit [Brevibacillus nitrificans]|uniref:Acetyl-CoA carboxylase biotin carboxyl carrier protein subunit n=1 Tax=Brevibacillus nitrificans TaxID=651560 RepID=A0A3M8DKW4_9BACL|nr:biotin/lipoyl-containing protein [Brevibacillus nitrificans]RNB88720.1 acetyl-CoA carboxylase biotin carboxyl carrier protein subunit [Brevibacillus nitrificans]